MTIIASCSHEVASVYELTPVRFGAEDCDAIDGFRPCVVHAEYCRDCAAKVETWPECIRSEAEEAEWLHGGANYQRWTNSNR